MRRREVSNTYVQRSLTINTTHGLSATSRGSLYYHATLSALSHPALPCPVLLSVWYHSAVNIGAIPMMTVQCHEAEQSDVSLDYEMKS